MGDLSVQILCRESVEAMMARVYSEDDWDLVKDAGTSALAAAERSGIRIGVGVGVAPIWVRRARSGERVARKQGQPRRLMLDAHFENLLGLIAAEPDLTIAKSVERLRSEAGVLAVVGTV